MGVQVLMWGLRELKRVNLLSVDHPVVDIECAGTRVTSRVMPAFDKNCNYEDPLTYMDIVRIMPSR